VLRALDPGLAATVQDLGRPGHGALGVARSGAADALSLVVANRLAGNADGAAALELTLTGGAWAVEAPLTVALAGADMGATLERGDGSRAALPWHAAHLLPSGSVLRLGAARRGARAYLAAAGGFAATSVLGSAATQPSARLGGLAGRALVRGDVVACTAPSRTSRARALDPAGVREIEGWLAAPRIRATAGAHAERFDARTREAFWAGEFRVSAQTDRMGARLAGPVGASPDGGRLTTEPLAPGSVEVPGPGEAIVLLADAPPTGGYPVIACVATVDMPRCGQLRPHERVRFEEVGLEEARDAWARRRDRLATLLPPA
jgi:antagonist of KipI